VSNADGGELGGVTKSVGLGGTGKYLESRKLPASEFSTKIWSGRELGGGAVIVEKTEPGRVKRSVWLAGPVGTATLVRLAERWEIRRMMSEKLIP
jgi:hypothetical protein